MSTTMTDPVTTTPTPVPVEPDPVSMFYDQTVPVEELPLLEIPSPTPQTDAGLEALPTTEPASPTPATAKLETPPLGTETKEQEKKSADEKGHAAAARRLGSEVATLKRELQAVADDNRVLKAKLDGTYEEPTAPTAADVEMRAEFKGRETASRAVADGLYGAEVVQAQVYDDASPYKTLVQAQPWLHVRVAKSAQPTVEAMRVLKEQEFLAKYGTDATQWVSKIEAELKPKMLDEFKKQSVTPVTGRQAPSVTEARGSGGTAREKSLEDLFYGKPPTA